MKKMQRILPVLMIVLVVVLGIAGFVRRCSAPAASIADTYIKPGDDTLSVAIEMSPLTYTLHNDTAEGFDYAILKDIAASHGIAISFHPVSQLEDAFLGLYEHRYDLLVASIPATNALREVFPLTDAVYLDKQVLVQRRDSGVTAPRITSQEQLLGDTVWVAHASPFGTRLRNMSKELGDTVFVFSEPEYSSEHLAILTALGEVKQAVVNEAVARHIAEDYPDLDISTPISFNQFQCWAVAPGDSALLDSLNVWLAHFKTTPQYRRLAEKYL